MQLPATVCFDSYGSTVPEALDRIGAGPVLAEKTAILIKPNLVTDQPFPVTTSPECCGAIIDYVRLWSRASIVIAEGVGDPANNTMTVFDRLGYGQLAAEKGVGLVDLNREPWVRLQNPDCRRFPEFFIPEIAMNHFIISVPVLKPHLLSVFTGSLKNMMGFAPPEHYAGKGGIWNKAEFHMDIHQAIMDMNRYRHADVSILDASVGLADHHLGGARCNPPVGKLVAGFNPLAVDRAAAGLLSLNWRSIGHLASDFI